MTTTRIAAVFFDVDGVLVDSLAAHLHYCARKAAEYGLPLTIPSPEAFKAIVHSGATVSPMMEFFRTLGFSDQLARRADESYQQDFPRLYRLKPFGGVDGMLEDLAAAGLPLGIVTSNTRTNISAALGARMERFTSDLVFTKDDVPGLSKEAALVKGAEELGVSTLSVVFVGDQWRDYEAAATAGSQFLGVSYGWGIESSDRQFPVVECPADVAQHVRARAVGGGAGAR